MRWLRRALPPRATALIELMVLLASGRWRRGLPAAQRTAGPMPDAPAPRQPSCGHYRNRGENGITVRGAAPRLCAAGASAPRAAGLPSFLSRRGAETEMQRPGGREAA